MNINLNRTYNKDPSKFCECIIPLDYNLQGVSKKKRILKGMLRFSNKPRLLITFWNRVKCNKVKNAILEFQVLCFQPSTLLVELIESVTYLAQQVSSHHGIRC